MHQSFERADDHIAWLLQTTNRMVGCTTVPSLLDLAYDAIRGGLGYDRVGLMVVDVDGVRLVEHVGTDDHGQKFHPPMRASCLADGDYHARLLADPRLQASGPGFILWDDPYHGVPDQAVVRFDGHPDQILRVALRLPDRVTGLISVDNLITGRRITPADAPPLVAFANALAAALRSVQMLEDRERRVAALDTDLRQRVAELEWLREISREVNAGGSLEAVLDTVYDGIRAGLRYDRVGIELLDYDANTFVEYLGTDAAGNKTRPTSRVASLSQDSDIWTMPGVAAVLRGAEYYYTTNAYAEWPEDTRFRFDGMPRQLLLVPLHAGDKVVGIITVDNLLTGRPICESDARPLLALAYQVDTAVENARKQRQILQAERANARAAQELAQLRDEFVATVSHELRSPLTAIIGYGELLEARWDQLADAHRRESIRRIVLSANRQLRLVEDLLLLSRLEHGTVRNDGVPTDIPAMALRAADEVRANYPDQRIDLEGCPAAYVRADPDKIVQIVVNLADNAAKYSPEGEPVTISWDLERRLAANAQSEAGLWVVLRVRDHGAGLPSRGRERLFQRFGRLDGSRTRSGRVGTGLGLYLSRQLARAMRGDLDLETTGPRGSVFRLSLPAVSAAGS